MKHQSIFWGLLICIVIYITTIGTIGCAQIGMPTGGAKDTLPPELVAAEPKEGSKNFTGNKITLTFNEYIDVQDIQSNLLMSPYPKSTPNISYKLKTVTVKLKDTLKPNTTYAVDFGNSLKDLNESNPYKNYTYVFSTGNIIDTLQLRGKVIIAETGKFDSTLIAILYKDASDSTVQYRKPDYIARINKEGVFTFKYLAAGAYKVYALKDGDGSKTYNSTIETFAFADKEIFLSDSVSPVTLYAYAEEKDTKKPPVNNNAPVGKNTADKKFKYTTTVNNANPLGLLSSFELTFNRPIKSFNANKILLTDSSYKKISFSNIELDSTQKIISIKANWADDFDYALIIDKDFTTDTLGTALAKTDTLHFKTKSKEDYGSLLLRFKNLTADKHLVLQIFKADALYKSVPITAATWSDNLFEPGEYELRILYDDNNNGKWNPGNYKEKRQPEKAVSLDKKLIIKAKWDNEREVEL